MMYPIDPYPKLIINAALTGLVPTKSHTPFIPLSEDEIVKDAVACARAGAAMVHLHVRDSEGKPDYRAECYGRIIRRIRGESDILICVSTTAMALVDFEKRSEVLLLEGKGKPELASLSTGSFNFPNRVSVNPPETIFKLAGMMLERGIKPELEVFDSGMINFARYMEKKVNFSKPLMFNFFLGALGGIPGRIGDLAYLIQNLPEGSVWSAAGLGVFQLPVNVAAMIAGGGVRVGLEDNLYFDYAKTKLATNEQLVQRVVQIAKLIGREIATPEDARAALRISSQ